MLWSGLLELPTRISPTSANSFYLFGSLPNRGIGDRNGPIPSQMQTAVEEVVPKEAAVVGRMATRSGVRAGTTQISSGLVDSYRRSGCRNLVVGSLRHLEG